MRSNIVSKLELLWEPETQQSNVAAQPPRPPPRPVLPIRQGGGIRADFGIYGMVQRVVSWIVLWMIEWMGQWMVKCMVQ